MNNKAAAGASYALFFAGTGLGLLGAVFPFYLEFYCYVQMGLKNSAADLFLGPMYLIYYRPVTVLVNTALYHLFGWNAFPVHVVSALALGLLLTILFRLFVLLGSPFVPAFLGTLLFALSPQVLWESWLSVGSEYHGLLFFFAALFSLVKSYRTVEKGKNAMLPLLFFTFFLFLGSFSTETSRVFGAAIVCVYVLIFRPAKISNIILLAVAVLFVLGTIPVLNVKPDLSGRQNVPFLSLLPAVFLLTLAQFLYPIALESVPLFFALSEWRKDEAGKKHLFFAGCLSILSLSLLFAMKPFEFFMFYSAVYPAAGYVHVMSVLSFFVLLFLFRARFSGDKVLAFFSTSILFILFIYLCSMFFKNIRIEPSTRHFVLVLPFLYWLFFHGAGRLWNEARNKKKFFRLSVKTGIAISIVCCFYHNFSGSFNLWQIMNAQSRVERDSQFYFVAADHREYALLSPDDGYSLSNWFAGVMLNRDDVVQVPRTLNPGRFFSLLGKIKGEKLFHFSKTKEKSGAKEDPADTVQKYRPYLKVSYAFLVYLTQSGLLPSFAEAYLEEHGALRFHSEREYVWIPQYAFDVLSRLARREKLLHRFVYIGNVYYLNDKEKR